MRLRARPRVLRRRRRSRFVRGRSSRLLAGLWRGPRAWLRRALPEGPHARPARSLPGVVAVLAIAALAGLAIRVAGGSDDRATRRAEPRPSAVVASGPVRVQVPPGWSTTDRVPRLPGMTPAQPVALVDPRSKVEAVVDALPASSQTLLPAAFVKGLAVDVPKPTTVRIGRQLEGYHYAGLVHPRVMRLLDVYVAPTTAGTVTVACLAEAVESLVDGCWAVVSQLAISRGRPLAPGAAAAFRQVLAGRVAALDAADARARRALRAAATPAEQARAVAPLPAAYRGAAAATTAIAPRSPAWPRLVVRSLEQTGLAYQAFEQSLLRADRAAYAQARTLLRARRARLQDLLHRFSPAAPKRAVR